MVWVYVQLRSIFSFKLREMEMSATLLPVLFILDYFIDGKSRAECGVRAMGLIARRYDRYGLN